MLDLKNKSVLVIDNGLFACVAERLARDFSKTWYYSPWKAAFPYRSHSCVGEGLEGVERVYDVWDYIPSADLIAFPDVGDGDLQAYLRKIGKRVWGSGDAEWLELDRWATRQMQETLGVSGPKTTRIVGLDALRDYLSGTSNQWVKVPIYRGDMETWQHIKPFTSAVKLDQLAKTLGPLAARQEFLVEENIEGIELAYDGFTIDGQWPDKSLWGYEVKDLGYVGVVKPYAELPQQIRDVNQAFAALLKEGTCRSYMGFEMRIGRDGIPVMIDPLMRFGSPPTEVNLELFSNFSEILWQGAAGIMVSPEPVAKYGVMALMHSQWALENWTPIQFPPELRRWIKFRFCTIVDGKAYFAPKETGMPEIGAVVGLGNTLQEALDRVREVAEQVEGFDLYIKTDSFDEALEAIKEGKEYGIAFDEALQVEPALILESKDASGHEHKGSGEGGGQFTGGEGGSESKATEPKKEAPSEIPLHPDDAKQIEQYRKLGIKEDKLATIAVTLSANRKANEHEEIERQPNKERQKVNAAVFTTLQERYGEPELSGRSSASYFKAGRQIIRFADHPPVYSRSDAHINVVTSGNDHPSNFHPECVVISTYKKTPEQVVKEVDAALALWRARDKPVKESLLPASSRRGLSATPDNLPAKIGTSEDWAPTKAMMVGVADNDVYPHYVPDWADPYGKREGGNAGKRIADADPNYAKCIEQLENLCEVLEREGITVYRPPLLDPKIGAAEPVGISQQFCRELFTIYGDVVYLNQMRAPYRNKEHGALEPFFGALEAKGVKIVRPPKVTLEPDLDYIGDPRPFIEGGDVFRFGDNVMVTHSGLASSLAGIRWLAEQLEPRTVWIAHLSKEWYHGDYVFCPINEGLCMAHLPAFRDGLPAFLRDWDVIDVTREEAGKLACNGTCIRPGVIIMPEGFPRIVRELERRGATAIEVPFDASDDGGVDCSCNELLEGE